MELTRTEKSKLDRLQKDIETKLRLSSDIDDTYDLSYYLEQINLIQEGTLDFDEGIISDMEFVLS